MNRTMLLDHLALIERYIRQSEQHLLHQREIVIGLESHGRGHSRTAKMIAREILASFKMDRSAYLNHRARVNNLADGALLFARRVATGHNGEVLLVSNCGANALACACV